MAFMPVEVDTSGRVYHDFSRLLFLHAHREDLLWLMNYGGIGSISFPSLWLCT
jgi:hypothetical protein